MNKIIILISIVVIGVGVMFLIEKINKLQSKNIRSFYEEIKNKENLDNYVDKLNDYVSYNFIDGYAYSKEDKNFLTKEYHKYLELIVQEFARKRTLIFQKGINNVSFYLSVYNYIEEYNEKNVKLLLLKIKLERTNVESSINNFNIENMTLNFYKIEMIEERINSEITNNELKSELKSIINNLKSGTEMSRNLERLKMIETTMGITKNTLGIINEIKNIFKLW